MLVWHLLNLTLLEMNYCKWGSFEVFESFKVEAGSEQQTEMMLYL